MPDREQRLGTLGDKLNEAGYKTLRQQLEEMMEETIRQVGAGRPEVCKHNFLALLHKANSTQLMWELFQTPIAMMAAGYLYQDVKEKMPKLKVVAEGEADGKLPQGHYNDASPSAAPVAGAGAEAEVPKGPSEIASAPAPAATGPKQLPTKKKKAALQIVMRKSILDTFMIRIDGRRMPLSEVTGRKLREWLRNHRRDCRFAELLDERVFIPDNVKVGGIVPPEIAEQCYQEATKMEFAA